MTVIKMSILHNGTSFTSYNNNDLVCGNTTVILVT